VNLGGFHSSTILITEAVMGLFDRITDPNLLVRRLNIVACRIRPEHLAVEEGDFTQMDLFADPREEERKQKQREKMKREKRRQQAVLTIKKKYGKNAILKGMNLEEGATAVDRNGQIGGHKA
jgi:DNA polymerase V